MAKAYEYVIYTIMTILVFICMIYLLFNTDYKFYIFIPLILYIWFLYLMKRNKKITEFVKYDFKKLGFEIISERPLNSSEREIEIEPAILINGIPLAKVKNKYSRVFTVKDENKRLLELKTEVIEKKNGKIYIKIIDKQLLANNA